LFKWFYIPKEILRYAELFTDKRYNQHGHRRLADHAPKNPLISICYMPQFIRYFAIACLLSMALITITLGYFYHRTVINHMIQHKVEEHTALSRMLVINLWKKYAIYTSDLQNRPPKELSLHPEVRDFNHEVKSRSDDFNPLLVNIYALNGKRIFSTDLQSVGESAAALSAFNKAVAGIPSTRLLYQKQAEVFGEPIPDRDVIINFIPIYDSNQTAVSAVAEVRSDLTRVITGIDRNQTEAYVVIAVNLGMLFGVLLVVVLRADRHMKRHTKHIELQQLLIEHQTYHDALTGLPNLKLFRDRLQHAIQLAEQRELLMAVLVVTFHRLKHVSDTFGHTTGDKLLLEAVQRLQSSVRSCDTVARAGGDEFYVMLESIAAIYEVEEIAANIIQEFSQPTAVDGQELFVTPSIGVVMFPFDATDDVETVIKKANTAMYNAIEAGRNTFRLYDCRMLNSITSRFSRETALRGAIERNEFELFYQPVVHLKSGKIIAVEALLRWRSPEQGLVPPSEFVPLLEETGLIIPVGNWVLETACEQIVSWQQQGIGDLKVNVNISAVQFSQKGIAAQVRTAIDRSGLMPHLLDLEITESLLIDDINNAMQILDVLNDMGIALSIDDFGTGYSSLAYLKRMPIGTLKIDRSFICDLNTDADDAAIVDAVCAMADSLRFSVTAEGVENREQLILLREMGVDAAQGYYFSRPLPVADVTKLLRQKSLLDSVA